MDINNPEKAAAFQNSILQAVQEANQYERQTLDAFLLHHFGSVDRVRAVAKYYVIEEEPMRFEVDDQIYDDTTKFRFTHTYRLRLKTPEELAHERADEIVEKNTAPNCIVCREPVQKDDLVDSQHGAYHSWCIDGHP